MHTQTAEICQASIFYQVLGKSFPGTELTPVTVRRTQITLYLWQLCRMHTESLFKLLQGLLGFRKLSKKKKNGELYWSSRELSLSYYYCNLCILEAEMENQSTNTFPFRATIRLEATQCCLLSEARNRNTVHIRTNFPPWLRLCVAGKAPFRPTQPRMEVPRVAAISNNLWSKHQRTCWNLLQQIKLWKREEKNSVWFCFVFLSTTSGCKLGAA